MFNNIYDYGMSRYGRALAGRTRMEWDGYGYPLLLTITMTCSFRTWDLDWRWGYRQIPRWLIHNILYNKKLI